MASRRILFHTRSKERNVSLAYVSMFFPLPRTEPEERLVGVL
jgi:hypothetical protein